MIMETVDGRTLRKVRGAFEVYKPDEKSNPICEQMVILSYGRLLERGDNFPYIKGRIFDPTSNLPRSRRNIEAPVKVGIYGFLNGFGTWDCNKQVASLEDLARMNPDIKVMSFCLQPIEEILDGIESGEILHQSLVSINREAAIELGLQLEPDKRGKERLADNAWKTALCRTLMVVDKNNVIQHIEQLMDQAKQPNFEAALLVAKDLLKRNIPLVLGSR